MSLRLKNVLYTVALLVVLYTLYLYREHTVAKGYVVTGKTMGTTYTVKYFSTDNVNLKPAIDSILTGFNYSLSTYIPNSEVSTFNDNSEFVFSSPYFYPVLKESEKIYNQSMGYFDPTVMPLVNAWGFGPKKIDKPDSSAIDSLRNFVGFDTMIAFDKTKVTKLKEGGELDFSSLAKGYGVDVLIEFLLSKGHHNAFVEIGGEVRTIGSNIVDDRAWSVGILDPSSTRDNRSYIAIASVENKALATSGNYFNYRIVDGVRYSHTLDPKTGFPAEKKILSASVIADQCMTADGFATAFMSMGHEQAIEIVNKIPEIEVYLVYSELDGKINTYSTNGFTLNNE